MLDFIDLIFGSIVSKKNSSIILTFYDKDGIDHRFKISNSINNDGICELEIVSHYWSNNKNNWIIDFEDKYSLFLSKDKANSIIEYIHSDNVKDNIYCIEIRIFESIINDYIDINFY